MGLDKWLIILVLAMMIMVIVVFMLSRRRVTNKEFDERQRLARGKAYQAAFWTLAAYLFLSAILNDVAGIQWADMTTGAFLGFFLAMTVFAMICIIRDSFLSFKERPGSYFIMLLAVIAVNLLVTICNLIEGTPLLTDGLLNIHSLNLFLVIAFIPISTALVVKYLHDKKQAETE